MSSQPMADQRGENKEIPAPLETLRLKGLLRRQND
jgi:hypothetical protein